jgi:integrase
MKGSIIRRGGRWSVILDTKDERGGRKRKWHSGYKTRREAEAACAKLISSMASGTYVEPAKLTVAQLLQDRLAQWEVKRVGAKAIERYRELVRNQIEPFLGTKLVQKLTTRDIEAWHSTLLTSGRRDGEGGVSTQTIRHVHRLLSTALKEAARHDLVAKNVAALQSPPKVEKEEVTIIGEAQISDLLAKLQDRALHTKVVISLFCGTRRGELLGLQWQDIDLDGARS